MWLEDAEPVIRVSTSAIVTALTTIVYIQLIKNHPLRIKMTSTPQGVLMQLAVALDYPIGVLPALSIWIAVSEAELYSMVFLTLVVTVFPFIVWFFKYLAIMKIKKS